MTGPSLLCNNIKRVSKQASNTCSVVCNMCNLCSWESEHVACYYLLIGYSMSVLSFSIKSKSTYWEILAQTVHEGKGRNQNRQYKEKTQRGVKRLKIKKCLPLVQKMSQKSKFIYKCQIRNWLITCCFTFLFFLIFLDLYLPL